MAKTEITKTKTKETKTTKVDKITGKAENAKVAKVSKPVVKEVKVAKAANAKKNKTIFAKVLNLNTGVNTIKVVLETKMRHEAYGKLIKRKKGFLVDLTEEQKAELEVGQMVEIMNVKPISKLKNWILVK